MKRATLYARVSTDDKGQSPENQLTELRCFASAQGWEVVAEFCGCFRYAIIHCAVYRNDSGKPKGLS
jgi:hypothetical protein